MIAWNRSCPDRQPFSDTFRDSYVVRSQYIKFIYSEKAQRYDEISKLFLSILLLSNVKKVLRLCHIFVAFSEYINFSNNSDQFECLFMVGPIYQFTFDSFKSIHRYTYMEFEFTIHGQGGMIQNGKIKNLQLLLSLLV